MAPQGKRSRSVRHVGMKWAFLKPGEHRDYQFGYSLKSKALTRSESA